MSYTGNLSYTLSTGPAYTNDYPIFSTYNTINGNMNFDGVGAVLSTLSLAVLRVVSGYVNFQYDSYLTSITFASLTFLGSYFDFYTNVILTSISCPMLSYVGGNIGPLSNPKLVSVSMPSLLTVGTFVEFCGNNATLVTPINILKVCIHENS